MNTQNILNFKNQLLTKILLWAGAAFFLFEFPLHFFGLSTLEHDKIFLFTHDRYVAAYALSLAVLFLLISTNLKKYKTLFIVTMLLVLVGMFSGSLIAFEGGYQTLFPVLTLDEDLILLGAGFYFWYIVLWVSWILNFKSKR